MQHEPNGGGTRPTVTLTIDPAQGLPAERR